MTAKLLIREVNAREFIQLNGEFPDATAAEAEGEKICTEGNGEAFQVWNLVVTKQRVWKLEEVLG